MSRDKNSQVLDIEDPRFRIRPIQQMTASCTGAILTSFFMTPLDVVKIRLQAQQKALLSNKCYLFCNGLMEHLCACGPGVTKNQNKIMYKGTLDAMVKITRMEGISTLWSGLYPTLLLALPSTVIYFVSYEQLRVRLNDAYATSTGKETNPIWIALIAGCTARISAVCIVSPIELVRTKMQSQKLSFADTKHTVKDLIKHKGIKGLWRGLPPTLMRDVPFSGIYWGAYESIKKNFGHENPSQNTMLFNFTGGALSGSLAATVTLPFDVVKTHQQIEIGEKEIFSVDPKHKPKGLIEQLKTIYKNNGLKGLFAGLAPRIAKVAPACAIMIATFEYGKLFFQEYNMKKFYGIEDKQGRNYILAYAPIAEKNSLTTPN